MAGPTQEERETKAEARARKYAPAIAAMLAGYSLDYAAAKIGVSSSTLGQVARQTGLIGKPGRRPKA